MFILIYATLFIEETFYPNKRMQILETYATLTRYTKIRARLVRASLRRNFRMRLQPRHGRGMPQPRHGPLVYFRHHTLPKARRAKRPPQLWRRLCRGSACLGAGQTRPYITKYKNLQCILWCKLSDGNI